jgi:iron complex outermembrane receptor protein
LNRFAASTALFVCAALPGAALAQRTTDNAITSSGDAFGKAVGNEKIGLYSVEDVRGFSPIEAGNARIEGLYFVQTDRPPTRAVESTTIKVGITAQGYPFPAPTGIVDYHLTLPGKESSLSFNATNAIYGPRFASVEGKWAISDTLGVYVGGGRGRPAHNEGDGYDVFNAATSIAWRPREGALIVGFAAVGNTDNEAATPTFFTAGAALPLQIKRGKTLSQKWTDKSSHGKTAGLIVKLPFGAWRVEAGLFNSRRKVSATYADLFTGVRADGSVAGHTIIADGDNKDNSLSGEFRLIRTFTTASLRHTLTASARGRSLNRSFGGTQAIRLGPGSILAADLRAKPLITLSPNDKDTVRQMTVGLEYGLNWAGKASVDLSVSRSRYRKRVDFANAALADLRIADDPWLGSIAGTAIISKRLTAYGGYVRGLEEAVIAPDIAINRSEAPPAVRTSQWDMGLRYAITPRLTLVGGVFSVRKPYFNVDPTLRFRQLGIITNKGVELSLSGALKPGLTLVAGSLFLDPVVSGPDVTAGLLGKRPVGSVTRRSIVNMDWRPQGGKSKWSFDFAFESLSARTANAANSFSAPPREALNIGARYRFSVGSAKALLRGQVQNITDDYGWVVSQSGGFTYSPRRNFSLELVVDL